MISSSSGHTTRWARIDVLGGPIRWCAAALLAVVPLAPVARAADAPATMPASAPAAPATAPAGTQPAASQPSPVSLAALVACPPAVQLDHQNDLQRLVVVGVYSDGQTGDLTGSTKVTLAPEGIAAMENGRMRPVKNGEAVLTAAAEGRSVQVKVVVKGVESARPISFRNDVLPVAMKAGCNSGGCHGSQEGKNGFRLSLFGFEPAKDYISLTRDLSGRRIDLAQPRQSLFLRKPFGEVEHGGGERLKPDSELSAVLTRWIEARVPDDPANLPTLSGIELMPRECVLRGSGRHMQLQVLARYSDGTDRDVTSLAVFNPTDPTTAAVDEAGLVTSGLKGEAFVMARFGTFAVVSQVIVLGEGEPFVWQDDAPPANYIDEAINAKLRKLQINPSPLCDGETFLRRVSLDLVGQLPTVEEYRRFAEEKAPDKRAKLIDALLARREFPEQWAMKWAEMLRIESGSNRISFKAMYLYNAWLRESILANKPMDRMVRELLGAEGGNFANPAANFYMVETSPTQMAENVAQVFCGIRVQCAQCHNHPFERWTQDDYYNFAAFFSQVGRKQAEDLREQVVFNSGSGEVSHLRTGQAMPPKFLGGPAPQIPAGGDRRKVLAEWLTSKDNPYFAASFVDRVWAHFLGRGLVEPPDDVRVSNPPSHPELRELLARKFVESNYDLRALVRTICNSRTYQRSSRATDGNRKDTRNFSHAMIRRLPAETLLDAVCQVTEVPEKFSGLPAGARAVQVADARSGSYFLDVFGRPARLSACTCERRNEPTLSQALHLINGPTLTAKIGSDAGRLTRQMKANTPAEAMIEDLYLAAYTRRPTDAEKAALLKVFNDAPDKRKAMEDIYWAVLNSKEFVFNH